MASPDLLVWSAFFRIAVGLLRGAARGEHGEEPPVPSHPLQRPVEAPATVGRERAAAGGENGLGGAGHRRLRLSPLLTSPHLTSTPCRPKKIFFFFRSPSACPLPAYELRFVGRE